MILTTLVLSSMLAASGDPSQAACPDTAHCASDGALLAVSSDPARAEAILAAMQTAQDRFSDVFERTPGQTAVIEDSNRFPGLALELGEAGYTVKPWVSPQAMRAALEAQIRPALEARLTGAPQAAIDQAVEGALAGRVDQSEKVRHADAIIGHELGHLWLRDTFDWPRVDTGGARAYGAAAAPDWLDETAAVLMESPGLTGERRTALCEALPADPGAELAQYFSMEHPLLQAASAAAARAAAAAEAAGQSSDGPQIMVMSGETLTRQGEDMIGASRFYGLTRALVDYVVAETGSEHSFAALADAIASGGTLDSWLSAGVDGLPRSEAALIDALGADIVQRCAG